MTNSDSGTKFNPGDRVRIAHNPKHDREYDANEAPKRALLHGLAGKIRERQAGHGLCFRVVVDDGRGAWFEADELSPIAAPLDVLDAAVQQALAQARREAQGWHSAALLARGEAEEARDALRVVQGEADALRGKLVAADAKLRAEDGARVAWRNEALREQGERKAAEAALAAERSIHETAAIGADKLAKRLADVGAAWGRMRAFLLALPRPLGAAGIEGVDMVDKALGGVVVAEQKAKVAGPWTRGPVMGVWYRVDRTRAEDDVARVYAEPAAYDVPSGWYVYDGPRVMRSGPEKCEPGKAAADRALLAAGWTLESGAKPEREDCPRCVYWRTEIETRVARLESGEALAKMLEGYGDARRP